MCKTNIYISAVCAHLKTVVNDIRQKGKKYNIDKKKIIIKLQ